MTAVPVGPILETGPVATAIIAAIRRAHPDATTIDEGSYVRVVVPGHCRVARAAVEEELGAPFRLPRDLEQVMTSFQGRFAVDEDEAQWTAGVTS